jgi:hypothetical protein
LKGKFFGNVRLALFYYSLLFVFGLPPGFAVLAFGAAFVLAAAFSSVASSISAIGAFFNIDAIPCNGIRYLFTP